jgi:hypothetical protein
VRAVESEERRCRRADAAGAAGYDGDLAGEVRIPGSGIEREGGGVGARRSIGYLQASVKLIVTIKL